MEVLIALIVISFLSGIVAGMGGSSGFIPIVGLLFLTSLSTQQISGTIATSFFIATFFGALLYWYSGHQKASLLLVLAPFGIVGTQVGTYINTFVSEDVFTVIIGGIAIILGLLLLRPQVDFEIDFETYSGKLLLILLGFSVGVLAGVTGIGGIPIIVPALLLFNVHPLTSIATGFAVAAVNTFSTSVSYYLRDLVEFEYILVIGIPFALAQVIGWKISPRINTHRLELYLGVFNVIMGGYLFWSVF